MNKRLFVSITTASTDHTQGMTKIVDFVNIQTYSGGAGQTAQQYINNKFEEHQLLYGIHPEDTTRQADRKSIDQVFEAYQNSGKPLRGIHLWRLNAHNRVYENQVQALVYDTLHHTYSGGVTTSERTGIWAIGIGPR
jgi:hypothetical protein